MVHHRLWIEREKSLIRSGDDKVEVEGRGDPQHGERVFQISH
jgi:hypothetical protein